MKQRWPSRDILTFGEVFENSLTSGSSLENILYFGNLSAWFKVAVCPKNEKNDCGLKNVNGMMLCTTSTLTSSWFVKRTVTITCEYV